MPSLSAFSGAGLSARLTAEAAAAPAALAAAALATASGWIRGYGRCWRELTADERAAALAEVAGILEGASEGELDEPQARQAAQFCRDAGADPDAIQAWIEEGRRRSPTARMLPPSGGLRGR